ncbi:hypothetical protein BJ875DRAFT_455669 [Amylocarpus encephaloides]|uniref:Uncharacterized protein n=1 Tax=Amylocarpus encephaloides TaxID=45428 RepID=A0A9P7YN89_9HELO|nr:hypothetical protein BJ875DRAFT_455669 [Amylocarpus encephaloides]
MRVGTVRYYPNHHVRAPAKRHRSPTPPIIHITTHSRNHTSPPPSPSRPRPRPTIPRLRLQQSVVLRCPTDRHFHPLLTRRLLRPLPWVTAGTTLGLVEPEHISTAPAVTPRRRQVGGRVEPHLFSLMIQVPLSNEEPFSPHEIPVSAARGEGMDECHSRSRRRNSLKYHASIGPISLPSTRSPSPPTR